jgi:hypothetical protein
MPMKPSGKAGSTPAWLTATPHAFAGVNMFFKTLSDFYERI